VRYVNGDGVSQESAGGVSTAHPPNDVLFQFEFQSDVLQACFRWGLFVVDETGVIIFATKLARTFLTAGCGIGERAGRLHVERSCVDRGLRELISLNAVNASEPNLPKKPLNVLGVPDREGRTRYMVKVFPLPAVTTRALALIAVSDLVESRPIDRSTMATVFNFSPREAELGELFSNGLRIEEIAPRMGIALNTARVHLRNVLAKTGCSNQIELARKFAYFLSFVPFVF
jgi:DNA-binding CsgD family transcriptional regulator